MKTVLANPRTRRTAAAILANQRTARAAAVIIATAALGLLAAACSTSASSGASSSSAGASSAASSSSSDPASSQLVAYSQCMRSHGVPNFPDPTSVGLPKANPQQFGVSSSQLQAAQAACAHLLPNASSFQQQAQQCMVAGNCPPALVHQMLTAERKFAQCMRSHGVPNWPDPSLDSQRRPIFNLTTVGITHSQTHSPPMTTTIATCQRLDPSPVPTESS
jgi:hypothetical protein